jgi:PEP-CTERM motif
VKNLLAAVFATLCFAGTAQAADPVVGTLSPGLSFAEYSSSTTTGEGLVDIDTLYFIDELTGLLGKSWFIFFDPNGGKDIFTTITFDAPITGVFTTQEQLDGSNATYGAPGINYGTSFLIGLEPMDAFSIVGNVLTINWHAVDPGDHIRVFTTAVPEPETYVLIMAGLLAVGFVGRRRSRI